MITDHRHLISSLITSAITFIKAGIYINPSRASPSSVKMSTPDAKYTTTYALHAGSTTNFGYAIFTSVILVTSSNIQEVSPDVQFRSISGTLCTQEWERLCPFFCMVFRQQQLHARVYEDAISFSTRARPKDPYPSSESYYNFRLLFYF